MLSPARLLVFPRKFYDMLPAFDAYFDKIWYKK